MSPDQPTLTHACPHKLSPSSRETEVLKLVQTVVSPRCCDCSKLLTFTSY